MHAGVVWELIDRCALSLQVSVMLCQRLQDWVSVNQWQSLLRQVIPGPVAPEPQHQCLVSSLCHILGSRVLLRQGLSRLISLGEGLVDLYTAMQPILDNINEERTSQREERAPKSKSQPAGEDNPEGPQHMKIAIIGQPNVVKPCLLTLWHSVSIQSPIGNVYSFSQSPWHAYNRYRLP